MRGFIKPLSLLEQVRMQAIRLKHYSIRTEEAYVNVIRRFILYHHKRYPKEIVVDEIRQYLSHLATDNVTSPLRRRTPRSQPSCFCIAK